MDNQWSFTSIWNTALDEPETRVYEPRDRLWASELGKPYSEVFLKLRGVQPTNPPNPRSLRKFEAGNVWEWILKLILMRAGILQGGQERVTYQYPDLLEVSGKMDFIAGGKPDWETAKDGLQGLMLPELFHRAFERIIADFSERYPKGLSTRILEAKSVSAFMYEVVERKQKPLTIHALQAFHYLKATGQKRADIIYICRDDCRMIEFAVLLGNRELEERYHTWIKEMSDHHFRGEMPALEEPIAFDEELGKFSKNNQVAWSPYLTMLYGLKDQAEFDEKYQGVAERWNRVLTRIKQGKKMTANNEAALEEIAAAGFPVASIMEKLVVDETEAESE